ncbi:MAG: response regulator [Melioribacteraceae bacterium]|jgi:DNA-binding LytR/AlgR family response regulator|nr:response regulator [Melioribacteraceae bacterium]
MDKILVIEDDKLLAENLVILLESEGYNVRLANNGVEGLDSITKNIPDLIICDINMPQMDGFELKEKLNNSKITFDIPLLFLTAKTQISELRQGMLLGADDYIFKPYNSDELVSIVKLRLGRRKDIEDKIKFSFVEKDRTYNVKDTFLVKGQKKSRVVKISDIKLIKADVQYSEIVVTNNKKLVMRVSLNEWELKLPGEIFKRVHKSTIVNFNFVEFHFTEKGKYFLKVKNWEESVSISRRKYYSLKFK